MLSKDFQNLFPDELDRLLMPFSSPVVRENALEFFSDLFSSRKEALDKIAQLPFFKSPEEYEKAIAEIIRECVDTVLKGFEKFRDSR